MHAFSPSEARTLHRHNVYYLFIIDSVYPTTKRTSGFGFLECMCCYDTQGHDANVAGALLDLAIVTCHGNTL